MLRQQRRTLVSIEIELEWLSLRRLARITDISIGGCFINSLKPIPAGERIAFRIKDGNGVDLALNGQVVYVYTGLGFGVRFVDLVESERLIVEEIILAHHGDPWAVDTNFVSRDAVIIPSLPMAESQSL
jgi:hypothetical protein